MLEWTHLESSHKNATATIAFDFGRQLGNVTAEFEGLMDHYFDGIRRRNNDPAASNGRVDEPS